MKRKVVYFMSELPDNDFEIKITHGPGPWYDHVCVIA
jgi:hypothetical protein